MTNESPSRVITTPWNFILAPLGTAWTRLSAAETVRVFETCATPLEAAAKTKTITESRLKKYNLRTPYLLISILLLIFRDTDACLRAPNRSGRLHGRVAVYTGVGARVREILSQSA